MKSLTLNEVRQKFLDFFHSKEHKLVSSDSLVPKDDPTVLFTTAGMQQFKPQFMGQITDFTRAATSQKCLRTDDLEEVGVTDFHHTFFEMLGNFSFGDYFKKEAIHWAWEFLTQEIGIPTNKIWVTVHEEDEEAYGIWINEIKIDKNRIVKLGDKSNFWPANARVNGPNGPCGPCSEIFYDWGVTPELNNENDDPGNDEHGRFCEVWNLVFTQYNRKDGGVLEPLPSKNIDTGMGLERLTAVIQGKHNNFQIDMFESILSSIDAQGVELTLRNKRLIADHLRAVVFGINDGVIPSNEGRGYIMRKLIVDMTDIELRAGASEPFIYKLVPSVVAAMKDQYPEIEAQAEEIADLIQRIERAYMKVIRERSPQLINDLKKVKTEAELGQLIFRYYDTYGMKFEAIVEIVTNNPLAINDADEAFIKKSFETFYTLMKKQKEQARATSKMQGDVFTDEDFGSDVSKTKFVGYDTLECDAQVLKIIHNGASVDQVTQGDQVTVILDQTPFYAESGGQVGDAGHISADGVSITINDTQKKNDIFFHTAVVSKGSLNVGDAVKVSVDAKRRDAIVKHHTATHLLQAALTQVLGEHVKQQGSLVNDEKLRFDFTHHKAINEKQIAQIEQIVNTYIKQNDAVTTEALPIDQAKEKGARAYFAEKYGDIVRVVSASDYSVEFCGGTHVKSTGDIGAVKVVSQGAVAQGIRRIEAVAGDLVDQFNQEQQGQLQEKLNGLTAKVEKLIQEMAAAGQKIDTQVLPKNLDEAIDAQVKFIKQLEKKFGDVRFNALKVNVDQIVEQADSVADTKIISHIFDGVDINNLRRLSDLIKDKASSSVSVLGAKTEDAASIIVVITEDVVKGGIKAGDIVKEVAPLMDGSGGGRPNMAQAGSKSPEKLDTAIQAGVALVKDKLNETANANG